MRNYGLSRPDIMQEQDASYETIKELIDGARHKIVTNKGRGLKTLIIVHYGGHGVMKGNVTHAVVNDPVKPLYPIETMCRSLSKVAGGYVIALLDCCRAKFDVEKFRGPQDRDIIIEDEVLLGAMAGSQNLIMIFGCEPNRRVNAESCLVQDFLARVDESTLPNGSIILPGRLSNFRTSNGGEALCPVD